LQFLLLLISPDTLDQEKNGFGVLAPVYVSSSPFFEILQEGGILLTCSSSENWKNNGSGDTN